MGKPEFKSPRYKNALTKSRPLLVRSRGPLVRSSANVRVVVRVRPPNDREKGDTGHVVKVLDEQVLIFDPKITSQAFFYHGVEQKGRDLLRKANKNLQFVFDRVFGFESNNEELFENTTKSLIQSLMDGYNCSVFAYGATGAGKTHTMIGHPDSPGITYLTMAELFKIKDTLQQERTFELGMSYIEVYNELVQDLLNPGAPLQLRDDGRYGVMVSGIKIHKIENPEELFILLAKGNGNRTQHPTDANAESSRSHAVFQVYIQMEIKATREVRAAKLSMIDLAGSERGSATGYSGARFNEGANINKSLLALGNCINSLADGQKYIPYRDSKLTRLLKDSLGGNCQTVMVANVSPSSLSYDDTYNTLKYATRAKKIKSDVKKNVVDVQLHAGEYVRIVEGLKKELEKAKAQLKEKNNETRSERNIDPNVLVEFEKLIEEQRKLLDKMHNIESNESVVILRKDLKEDVTARLSGLLSDSNEKQEAHRRLANTMDRFGRRKDTLDTEIAQLKIEKLALEEKTNDFITEHPEIIKEAELEKAKLKQLETQYQYDVAQKKSIFMEKELKNRALLLDQACKMLQTCFLQLKGHGFATDSLQSDYQSLVTVLMGKETIKWDSPLDSGLSSASSVTSTCAEVKPVKRKGTDENTDMNNTFVLQPPKPRAKVCAEQLMAKVYSSPNAIKRKREITAQKERRGILTTRAKAAIDKKDQVLSRPDLTKQRPAFRF